ncbi:copper resistance CopC family protein [Corynebacterium sp. 13CS0277]|uniref:copper resistance CopC family protein n=1 Tax=Corynebacterium sp. 13CS0277 TaxID=2071994 RepID=UPI001E61C386|nr:copper resistance CopC family protein [Corynebacterium sp. 13CS0277]
MSFSSVCRAGVAAATLAAGVALAPAAVAPQAFAHDVVVGGNPADGQTVEEFPREITLEFSGIPQDSFNTVAVSREGTGEVLFKGEPALVNQNVTLVVPDGMDPGPGSYIVGFQITSSDGHATRGKTTFTVAGDSDPVAAPAGTASPTTAAGDGSAGAVAEEDSGASDSGAGWLLPVLLGGLAVAALVSMALVVTKRKA